MFKVNNDFEQTDIAECVPEIIYRYLFGGESLTAIEKTVFNTEKYKGWISKIILNFYGINTDGANKGIYKNQEIKEVVEMLNGSTNKKHNNVAKLLVDRYI